ncbi:membrane-associated protein, putative, partial [Bodo saltans]
MANCCAITYIVFSGIAAILAITACFVPILSIVDTNYDDDGMMRKLPGSAIASHTQPSKRVASAESITEAQCPVFSGQCSGIWAYQYSTSEFLDQYGCKGGLTTARALCVLFIVFTCVSVLSQFLAINNLRNVRRAKISTSLTGSAGLICGVVGAYNQLNISQCLRNNYYFTGTYDGAFMVMISAIVILVGCAFHFFSTLGMIASWWCGCCGDQPGSYYNPYNLAPGQQGAAMYYNEQVPLNQQQPIVGSVVPPQPQVPLGYPQPGGYQQQPVGYAQQGGYQQQPTGNPQQQVGYP